MTTPVPRRLLLGTLAITAALIATATPAHAASTTLTSAARLAQIAVTDCPKTAGKDCRAFFLEAKLKGSALGIETKSFRVIAYPAQSAANGLIVTSAPISEGTVPTGTFTLATTGKTAKIKFTVDLACSTVPCAISGPYTFTLSISRNPTTSKLTVHVDSEVIDLPNCLTTTTSIGIEHAAFKGTGSVKGNGSTKPMHVYLPSGEDNFLSGKFNVERRSLSCPAEV